MSDQMHGKDKAAPIRIPFHRIAYDHEEEEAVCRVLQSKWITSGSECQKLEDSFAQAVKADYAVSVSSATAGLHLALLLGDLPPGASVALSALTFASCAQVIIQSRLRPVFIDIAPASFHMDPDALERCILALQKSDHPVAAIMCVHYAGEARFIEAYTALAEKYALWLVEDAAHCAPITTTTHRYPAKDVAVFSFYATKPLSAAEGGILCVNDSQLAQRAQVLRSHGISQQSWARYKAQSANYEVVSDGFKYNLSDVQAALARVQLKKQVDLQRRRENIAETYHTLLKETPYITLPTKVQAVHAWHLFVIQIHPEYCTRKHLILTLQTAGIQTSIHFVPLHHQVHFKPYVHDPLVQLDAIAEHILSLPIYPDLNTDDIADITSHIKALQ